VADRAREGIFSSLAGDVEEARVVDLFAGTGAMGIEALSRGATSCTFVDRSRTALETVRDNLSRTGLSEGAQVVRSEVRRFLERTAAENGRRYDLCLLDPPYAMPGEEVSGVLRSLVPGVLSAGWTVVLTREKRSFTPVIPVDWRVARRLEYGDGLAIIYREV
jgi:16S rRNA (guanine966-N2)-methyltransferase